LKEKIVFLHSTNASSAKRFKRRKAVLGGIAQQSTEGDNRRQGSKVQERD
jgi:hypothetical protein